MRGRDGNYKITGLLMDRDRAKLHQQLHADDDEPQEVQILSQQPEQALVVVLP